MKTLSIAQHLLVEKVGDGYLAFQPDGKIVFRAEGAFARVIELVLAGRSPGSHDSWIVQELVAQGVLVASRSEFTPSRRQVIALSGASAGAGLSALFLSTSAAASSGGCQVIDWDDFGIFLYLSLAGGSTAESPPADGTRTANLELQFERSGEGDLRDGAFWADMDQDFEFVLYRDGVIVESQTFNLQEAIGAGGDYYADEVIVSFVINTQQDLERWQGWYNSNDWVLFSDANRACPTLRRPQGS